jgi:hypothetical protein
MRHFSTRTIARLEDQTMPIREDLPATIKRSPTKAQEPFGQDA